MNRIICVLGMTCLAVVLNFGCANQLVTSEILQQGVEDKIYTACNLWINDPENIDCRNIQQGEILPLGTVVEVLEATDRKVVFADGEGQSYTIHFQPGLMMIPMENYLQQIFTLTPPEKLLENVSEENRNFIRRGVVAPGMNAQEVIFCYGYPVASRTPNLNNSSYLYYLEADRTLRILFTDGKVSAKVDSEEGK